MALEGLGLEVGVAVGGSKVNGAGPLKIYSIEVIFLKRNCP